MILALMGPHISVIAALVPMLSPILTKLARQRRNVYP